MHFTTFTHDALQVKRSFLRALAVVFTVFTAFTAFAQQVAAQPDGDLATLLQKVVDLPELQAYYPLDTDKRVKPLVVMQHGVSFPTSIPVAHHSMPLIFKSKQEIIQEPAYFLFWRFDIAADKARLEFSYIYNAGSPTPSAQKVELVFDKTDKNWTITSSNIQKVQL